MGAPQSFDRRTDIPLSMRAARGVDTSWKEEARCRGSHRPADLPDFAFTVDPKDRGPLLLGRPAAAWIAMALIVCQGCPVQYGCARFAIEVGEKWGTWGMHTDDLKRLLKLGKVGAHRVVDVAEDHGVPVQVAVRRVHEEHAMRGMVSA